MPRRPTALVLYNWRGQWPMRRWEHQRIFAWKAHFPGRVVFLNLGFPFNPAWIAALDPEVVLFDATALAARYTPKGWSALERASAAIPPRARRVAAPLDEFLSLQRLRDALAQARIDLLLTALDPALWDSFYPPVGRSYEIRRFLTAYVDDGLVRLARRVSPDIARRPIAVSYRAWAAPAWLGEMGALKREVGLRAAAWAKDRGHRADVAVDGERRLVGDAWIRLLGASRAVAGVEGGSSLIDPDGALPLDAAQPPGWTPPSSAILLAPPAEVRALSPRHLEAVVTRTFQVLVEGDYCGVLEAGAHYQPVGRDLADMDAALDRSRDLTHAKAMVDRAYDEIVASGRYSWRTAVRSVSAQVLA